MTIQRMGTGAWFVKHAGRASTFFVYDFMAMVEWARQMQLRAKTLGEIGL